MANEIRLRSNNISGTITDNPLAIGATTINSPGFADLPVVDATSHLILILDPLEVGGTAEIVRVTAHTAAATSVTVQRGQEGSVARSHVFNTTWFHGPVASDFQLPLPVPAVVLASSVNVNVANGSVVVPAWDTESVDTANMHDNGNPSRITCRLSGLYLVSACAFYGADTDWTINAIFVQSNLVPGTNVLNQVTGATTNGSLGYSIAVSGILKLTLNEFLNVALFQQNTSAQTHQMQAVNSSFSAHYLGPGT